MDRPRLGLIGVGRWGRRYLATIDRLGCARLSAVTTSQTTLELPAGCRAFRTWPEMLDGPALDGVVLAVPPQLHRPIAEACLDRRIPVLLEKPMATSLADAQHIAEVAAHAGVPVLVDHTHLFSPAFQRLGQLVGPGPLTIHGEGGGDGPVGRPVDPLWDWGPHDIAMCLQLTAAPPASVAARRITETPDGRSLTELRLRFPGGDEALLVVGNAMAAKRRLFEVDDGSQLLIYDDLAPDKLIRRRAGGEAGEDTVPIADEWPLDRVVKEFAGLIGSGATGHPSLELGVDVVRVLTAADQAVTAAGQSG
jgi:predicted dehydrogenase